MNTEKTSHKKRMKDAAGRLFALAASAVIALSAPVPYMRAFAADTPVVESRDPEDAVKGHVYIRAALQEMSQATGSMTYRLYTAGRHRK